MGFVETLQLDHIFAVENLNFMTQLMMNMSVGLIHIDLDVKKVSHILFEMTHFSLD